MSTSNHNEAGQGEGIPTMQEVASWNDEQLLEWIQRTEPTLFRDQKHLQKFKEAHINGSTFLAYAGDLDFFERTRLPLGTYGGLAALARVVATRRFIP